MILSKLRSNSFIRMGPSSSLLTLYSMITPSEYYVLENIIENGSKCSIFNSIFQKYSKLNLNFFQCCLKIENDVMILKEPME